MQTSDALDKAADRIQQYGHHKGGGFRDFDTQTSPACAMGAIRLVAGREWEPALQALRAYVPGGFIGAWNDAPERTAEEVIATLRAAALIEAAKENAETREPVSA